MQSNKHELEALRWDAHGLLPVIIQDARTNDILTLAHANREALQETLRTKATVLFSRSRNALWRKGETSGNTQTVQSVSYDCDADALLYRVIPDGPACHTGQTSCFYQHLMDEPPSPSAFTRAITHLQMVLAQRKSASPDDSYVARLYAKGVDGICKKIGEEAAEVVIAAKNNDKREIVWESSDLLFHLMVLLSHLDIDLNAVGSELLERSKIKK